MWRKLEHDESTTVEVAAGLEAGRGFEVAGADGRHGANRRRRARPRFSHMALAVAIAVPVVLAAAALVALRHHNSAGPTPASHHHAAVQSPSQRLADGTISCYFASSGPLHAMGGNADAGPDPATGQSPIAFCRRWYGFNAHTGINAARVKFVACQSSPTNVAVYVSDGRSGQCERLGHGPLPAGYTAARHKLASLGRALVAIQHLHNCVTPAALAAEVRPALARLGFARLADRAPGCTTGSAVRAASRNWRGLRRDRQQPARLRAAVRRYPTRRVHIDRTVRIDRAVDKPDFAAALSTKLPALLHGELDPRSRAPGVRDHADAPAFCDHHIKRGAVSAPLPAALQRRLRAL